MDRLQLLGIECQVHIGLEEEERARRQRVVVDVELEGGLERMDGDGARRGLADDVRGFLTSGRFVLVEATIYALARRLFERAPARSVRVRFHKFVLPDVDHVAIDMIFRREEVL